MHLGKVVEWLRVYWIGRVKRVFLPQVSAILPLRSNLGIHPHAPAGRHHRDDHRLRNVFPNGHEDHVGHIAGFYLYIHACNIFFSSLKKKGFVIKVSHVFYYFSATSSHWKWHQSRLCLFIRGHLLFSFHFLRTNILPTKGLKNHQWNWFHFLQKRQSTVLRLCKKWNVGSGLCFYISFLTKAASLNGAIPL